MIQEYLNQLQQELATGSALEHSYRPALKKLMESLQEDVIAVNDPSRSSHGAPDFVFLNRKNTNLILGYAETKDIYVDLDKIENSEQLKRYMGYPNLILTNYIEFRFFNNGEKVQQITIAKKDNSFVKPIPENFLFLERELKSFLQGKPQPITSGKRLSQIMGGKARRIRENVIRFLKSEDERNEELLRIYKVIQKLLVNDLEEAKFADMYAQTLVYGLFVARYYDNTPETFSRQEARDLIPASNPFLRHFFDHIAGPDFDPRLKYIVDELCDVFSVSDIKAIIQKHYNLFGEVTDKDPIIHFYEDFLKEYDPILKKQMGAYYTPVPVVQFIVHAVDDILKKEFNLSHGLSSTETIDYKITIQGKEQKHKLHKVQFLDPAVGTATFLNETIKFVYKNFKNQQGGWRSYVENELLPRMYGFELMMAPYTIAHLKLAMTLKETGIEEFHKRLGVYLTNTLEEGIKHEGDLFSIGLAEAISEEAQSASIVKNERPIMVVMGNPPYSGESFNKGSYAMKLVEKYKYEPGGKEKLKERNPKWINDDYVKFIAFAQEMITKTGEGVVAMITNHGYLDNPTFRGMRWNLCNTFSEIYVLDLHGNSKKKEMAPDGGKDENVFDIQQGVSIIIAIKKKGKKEDLADVYRADTWGKRHEKFDFLLENTIEKVKWEKINLKEPMYFFLNKDEGLEEEYNKGIKINELFPVSTVGIVTSRDAFVIDENREKLAQRIEDFMDGRIDGFEVKETTSFNFAKAKSLGFDKRNIQPILYRPFDNRFIYYNDYFIERPRKNVMKNFLNRDNFGLITVRQVAEDSGFNHAFISKDIAESRMTLSNKGICYYFPLFLYTENAGQLSISEGSRKININIELIKILLRNIKNYKWENGLDKSGINSIGPLDVLDYVYAVLYSSSYRKEYKDFLKSDFPRIPIARDAESFWKLVKLGGKLRQLHLLEDPDLSNTDTSYPSVGSNKVEKVKYTGDKIFINDAQYFGNIPKGVWEFYIGGYQPAQKWLKDRKGRELNYEDITHYQKIIASLKNTIQLMKEIDQVIQF